jgi:hypothetical protein
VGAVTPVSFGAPSGAPAQATATPTSRRRVLAVAAPFLFYLVFAANFSAYRVFGDGVGYYDFMRRLIGESVDARAYQFGAALWNAPFYLAAKVAGHAIGRSGVAGFSFGEAAITVASNTAALAAAYLVWRLLARLELPRSSVLLVLAVFGTPLFYYATLSPSYTHAVDALATSAMALLLLEALERSSYRACVALGATLGFAAVVRYANVGLWIGALLPFLVVRRFRLAAATLGAGVAAAALLFAVPFARGIPISTGWTTAHASHSADSVRGTLDPSAPLKMLFSLHRGIFTWTPFTALGVVGLVLLIARSQGRLRLYYSSLAASAVGVLAVYALVGGSIWDGGWSFSNRFLTGLFPLFAVGAAELIRRRRALGYGALALCAAFSVFLGLNHAFGVSQQDGADDLIGAYVHGTRTLGDFLHLFVSYSRFHHF